MKVFQTKRVRVVVDVQLKALLRLPTAGRRRRGQDLTCDACGEEIAEETFLGGFAEGHPNMLLHERCVPEADKARLLKPVQAQHPQHQNGRKAY